MCCFLQFLQIGSERLIALTGDDKTSDLRVLRRLAGTNNLIQWSLWFFFSIDDRSSGRCNSVDATRSVQLNRCNFELTTFVLRLKKLPVGMEGVLRNHSRILRLLPESFRESSGNDSSLDIGSSLVLFDL